MDKEFIEYLKSRISIADVISSRVKLKRRGHDWVCLCPFHKEKTESFKVDEAKGFYYCFGCGASGDAIKFIMDFDKVSFQDAVKKIAERYSIPVPERTKRAANNPHERLYKIMSLASSYFEENLRSKDGSDALKYLNMRKVKKESIEKFRLGFAPSNSDLYNLLRSKGFSNDELVRTGIFAKYTSHEGIFNRYANRLIFPILDASGRCVGFGGRVLNKSDKAKYINSPETEIYVKNQQLYGYNLAKRSRQIVIVEGYLDVIAMHQAGFNGATAPLGTSFSETQISMCWKVCHDPIIALDGDFAGIRASYRWTDKILSCLETGKSFRFASLPQGSDPDLLICNGQESAISQALNNSIPLSDWLWEGAFMLFPSDTPEQKAALVQMLQDKAQQVQNQSIRNLYIQDIREKARSLYRHKTKVTTKENLYSVSSSKEKFEKIFVVTILNHPYIIDRVMENFVALEFENAKMKSLKEEILGYYTKFANEDFSKFADAMAELKNTVDVKGALLHAGFADASVSDDEAVAGWLQLFDSYRYKPSLDADLKRVSSDFNFSEDNWQRLKALKNEVISARAKRQE